MDALEILHSKNYCHRDLKPQNILITENFNLKLCDFGEAKYIIDISREALQEDYEIRKNKHVP